MKLRNQQTFSQNTVLFSISHFCLWGIRVMSSARSQPFSLSSWLRSPLSPSGAAFACAIIQTVTLMIIAVIMAWQWRMGAGNLGAREVTPGSIRALPG